MQTKEKKLFTKIESGKFKGKMLILPSLSTTRSTKSIVRSCVFNVLRDELRGKVFIEAFGGSASMALEALSNEALRAYAIELDKKAYQIALKNARIDTNLKVFHGSSFELLPKLVLDEEQIILYLDPPFDIRTSFENIYKKTLQMLLDLNLEKIYKIIIEHRSKINMPLNLGSLTRTKLKKFGSTSLSFYEKV
ncbi:16S rRNA (guanine(966)-N(2))-methyltransferase RsmD [Campylobacter sp. MIT 99-7217]|uniref:RsmD family RNA methyltransferase n=1 Tax=Campylobacter sp. MIT 99-7217 TaxID=535091 RepID=UPI001157BA35|nr:RsmD family RNA methyltransferase [Campylobacter sp. MIT 99-7217]TQR34431.1 16S rRNA (guanine(966)-N(2))-methyltransferase RsmD [Campylobacter sp. MIT 99-7217]